MAEISTKLILDGVTLGLHKAFPSSNIHIETIKQGLEDGDILVKLVSMGERADIGKRLNRFPGFDIAYFGADNEDNINATDVLLDTLRIITLPTGDIIRGVNITANCVDEVLHCTVSYDHRAYKPVEQVNKMSDLEVEIHDQ